MSNCHLCTLAPINREHTSLVVSLYCSSILDLRIGRVGFVVIHCELHKLQRIQWKLKPSGGWAATRTMHRVNDLHITDAMRHTVSFVCEYIDYVCSFFFSRISFVCSISRKWKFDYKRFCNRIQFIFESSIYQPRLCCAEWTKIIVSADSLIIFCIVEYWFGEWNQRGIYSWIHMNKWMEIDCGSYCAIRWTSKQFAAKIEMNENLNQFSLLSSSIAARERFQSSEDESLGSEQEAEAERELQRHTTMGTFTALNTSVEEFDE